MASLGLVTVQFTDNFLGNLNDIEQFLQDADASSAFDILLAELSDAVIPNLERFPDMGRFFSERSVGSVEASNASDMLAKKLKSMLDGGKIREYLLQDYLILYVRQGEEIFLLAIRHNRQRLFNFRALNC